MDLRRKKILKQVQKPFRYCGGEFNAPSIEPDAALKFVLCFPDVYEVGMSNLGMKIISEILNKKSDTCCETCYAPWPDMGAVLKSENMPLYSLETFTPLSGFDMIGFSLQYELSYTNVLYMLDLGGVPLLRTERGADMPIVIAGGPCTINPMPLTPFVDLFVIGDGENVIEQLAGLYLSNKQKQGDKRAFLAEAAQLEGVYVPLIDNRPVKRAILINLDQAAYPLKVQIPNAEAVHNRAVLEIFRGCERGCRFCQAGMIYRPARYRSPETLIGYARQLIENNGYDELSLSSLSTSDYPKLQELLTGLRPVLEQYKVKISLPSTRLDSFAGTFVEDTRKTSITFAPEAGTQRLRDVINKNISEEDLTASVTFAFSKGYSTVKLYFMIGLPTETMEDIAGIVTIAKKIKWLYKQHAVSPKSLSLSVSTATFVPKPFTPFQWERQIGLEEIGEIQLFLRRELKKIGVKYSWHDSKSSRLETVLARGDERLGNVLLSAYASGCVFDSWSDCFDYQKWIDAMAQNNLDFETYTEEQPADQPLSWDFVTAGPSKEFLSNERKLAYAGVVSKDCIHSCKDCGIRTSHKNAFLTTCRRKYDTV